jgi:hypothetical protein
MYHALEGLQEILDGDMDKREAGLIESHLEVAKRSDREELASLASVLSEYLEREKGQLLLAEHSNWKRSVKNWIHWDSESVTAHTTPLSPGF